MRLGDKFSAYVYIVYADMNLREGGPLILQCVRDCIICSQNVEEFDFACEEESDSVIQPSAIDGSCGITMDHFVNELS